MWGLRRHENSRVFTRRPVAVSVGRWLTAWTVKDAKLLFASLQRGQVCVSFAVSECISLYMSGRRLFHRIFQTDFHVRFTLLYRLWMIAAGGVMILCIPFWFTGVEQGYFYTFSSLVAAQVLFELGTSFVITQLTAHEMSKRGEVGAVERGDPHDRVALILQFSDSWFVRAALLFLVIVGGAGGLFFSTHGTLQLREWLGPWALLVIATAAGMRLVPRLALLEGAGEVGEVARLRLVQSVVGNILMWGLLFAGMKLWALAVLPATGLVFTYLWLRRHSLIRDLNVRRARGISSFLDWRKEVFPLQWRIALSWASGYLIFQAITPIAFAKLGTVEAGQIGLAFAIFNGVQSVGMSWMYTKTPRYAELVARNQRDALNALFVGALKLSVAVVLFGVLCVLLCVWLLGELHSGLEARLPDLSAMACFGVTTVANCIVFSLALYMRSHKEEPMLTSSIVGGVLVLSGVYIGASYSVLTTALAYMLITVGVGLPWAGLLFMGYYRRQTQHG